MSIPYHKIVEGLIRINGKAPDFEDYFYQKDIYDLDMSKAPSVLWKTSRQVGKSTNLKNKLIIDSILNDFYKTLYVAPTKEQMMRFSTDFSNTIKHSPVIAQLKSTNPDKVTHKSFKNGSEIYFSYASNSADRIRGLAGIAMVCIDEIQSVEDPDIIPVILEVSAESDKGYTLFAGTPLSSNNLIEYYWKNSVQHEWVIKCDGCGKFVVPYDADTMIKMIGKHGPICPYCGKDLYPPDGFWATVNDSKSYRHAFHVSRIIRYPKDRVKREKQWRDVLIKLEEYPEQRFHNEVLGVSVDVGGAVLSEIELDRATYDLPMTERKTSEYGVFDVVIGVDWGVAATTSFTTVCAGGYDTDGKFKVLYGKKFTGTDILQYIDEIAELFYKLNAVYIAADFGVGKTNNALLKTKVGSDRVLEMQYVAQNKLLTVNKETGLITIDRTEAIELVIHAIKTQHILLPKGIKPLAMDLLNIYEEETYSGRKVFRRDISKSDDFVHALTFAFTAANHFLVRR